MDHPAQTARKAILAQRDRKARLDKQVRLVLPGCKVRLVARGRLVKDRQAKTVPKGA
jgi:multidrug efflux pump subunit AcrA (membrane-fusion protein)